MIQKQTKTGGSKQSNKSSSLISSSSSQSSSELSKYQKKQLQLSKSNKNDKRVQKKTHKSNKNYSSRSRSDSQKQRSRSNKKQKNLKKKHSHRSRSRSRDNKKKSKQKKHQRNQKDYRTQKQKNSRYSRENRDRSRDRSRQKRNKYYYKDKNYDNKDIKYDDRKDKKYDNHKDKKYDDHKDYKERGRQRQIKIDKIPPIQTPQIQNKDNKDKLLPMQIPMPIQVSMTAITGQGRRRRQRSRSPLDYYRRNQGNNEGDFWDSFSWVPRMNYTPNVSSSALVNTKKMRRLMITNIPYQMGISKEDLRSLITRYMAQNYLKDSMNNCPVRELQINQDDHSVAVQLSSVEQTCRMCKLQKIQLFKGAINGVIRLGDSCYGNNIVTQAQNAAQAQAAAFAAINVLQNKKTNFSIQAHQNKGPQTSTLIRATNAVTPYMATHLTPQQWQQYHSDLIQGFSQYGKIVHQWFVKQIQKDLCADSGNLFVQFQSMEEAVKAMDDMQGRIYDQRLIQLYYVPREIYYPNFKKHITPPTIKAPLKPKVDNSLSLPQISKSSHIASSRTN